MSDYLLIGIICLGGIFIIALIIIGVWMISGKERTVPTSPVNTEYKVEEIKPETKLCPKCKSVVHKDASICPVCHKNITLWGMLTEATWKLYLSFLLLIISGVCLFCWLTIWLTNNK